MRKSAPALILTAAIALASGSAMALGDRAKERKTNEAAATTSQPAATPSQSASSASSTTAGLNGSGVTDKKSQVAQNDARCDESRYASRSAMPADCFDKQGTGAAAAQSTQGQSGGGSSGASSASSK